MNPHHPPKPGQAAAGMGQIGRPGARPGSGLGAIGQHGGQQRGQLIGRAGQRTLVVWVGLGCQGFMHFSHRRSHWLGELRRMHLVSRSGLARLAT
jgi:hypothetical protein